MIQGRLKTLSALRSHFQAGLPNRIGIAVSGGGDSMALLYALYECFADEPVELYVATVDHGLRPESAAEAEMVAQAAATLGMSHTTLRWQDRPTGGNLQDNARSARYRLLTAWAWEKNIPVIALGHTADDQAETVLSRMRREAGVNGLAGIPIRRTEKGIELVRPLLQVRRSDLRSYLKERGVSWVEDPSNEDTQFERIRFRQAMDTLSELGITVSGLSNIAGNMARARAALDWYTFLAARDVATVQAGAVVICQRQFRTLPEEIGHRLLTGAIHWLTQSHYAPRREPLQEAGRIVRMGGGITLAGCRVHTRSPQAWIFREFNALRSITCPPGQVWDKRWKVFGRAVDSCVVQALGPEGLQKCDTWRDIGVPSSVLESTPGIWENGRLISAPVAGFDNGWTTSLVESEEEFFASFLSH